MVLGWKRDFMHQASKDNTKETDTRAAVYAQTWLLLPKGKRWGDQPQQEAGLVTRRLVCRGRNFAPYAVVGAIGRMGAHRTGIRSHGERRIAPIVVLLVIGRPIV
jgi:hypothetical protein